MRNRMTRVRRSSRLLVLLVFSCAFGAAIWPVVAGDEQHQVVRTVSARFNDNGTALQLTILLANGDTVRKSYGDEDVGRIVKILDLGLRKDVRMYADLRGKELAALYVEFGAPAAFGQSRGE